MPALKHTTIPVGAKSKSKSRLNIIVTDFGERVKYVICMHEIAKWRLIVCVCECV